MTSVPDLVSALNTRFPDMLLEIEQNDLGNGWIDLPKGHSIEIRQGYGYGLHTELIDVGIGENPNEVYHDIDPLIIRLNELYS
jgi:hypothetical protein